MKNKLFTILVCFIFAATACKNNSKHDRNDDTTATEDTASVLNSEETPQLSEEEINKVYADYMTPGDMHQMLSSTVGEWDVQTISSTDKMIINGLYKESTYTGTMMSMPFMGKSIMGYDNAKKIFVSTWIDNFGSGIIMFEGKYDKATNSITMTGEYTDPATKKEVTWKQVTKMIDENTYTVEMYSIEGDKETKAMEQTATRKGEA